MGLSARGDSAREPGVTAWCRGEKPPGMVRSPRVDGHSTSTCDAPRALVKATLNLSTLAPATGPHKCIQLLPLMVKNSRGEGHESRRVSRGFQMYRLFLRAHKTRSGPVTLATRPIPGVTCLARPNETSWRSTFAGRVGR